MTVKPFQQANQLLREGKLEEATLMYRLAIEQNPQFYGAYQNLGETLGRLGRLDEAVEMYGKAIELKPSSGWLHQELGLLLEKLDLWQEAAVELRKAVEFCPGSAVAWQQLGDVLQKLGEKDEVIEVYRQALKIEPGLVEAKMKLEQLLCKTTSPHKEIQWDHNHLKNGKITKNDHQNSLNVTVNSQTTDVRLIAFYLPQYHPIPENDEWWGKGFTEWTNVTKAKPLFEGHYQPHLPADLGFYDLRLPDVREAQAELARKYGIYGFCYYYYWFNGKRLLERPLDDMLQSGKPDFPFCICWANENWTRRWDGLEQEILIAQEYSDRSYKDFAESLIPYLSDSRYIRVQGRPLILIYRIGHLPEPKEAISIWRQVFRERGIGEVHIGGVLGFGLNNPVALGCDSGVQFPPNSVSTVPLSASELIGNNNFSGCILDYKQTAINAIQEKLPDYQLFLSVMTSWDNTARRQQNATVWLNSEPENYEFWLRGTIEKAFKNYADTERIIFINAWNEWAEGSHLEPDRKYGSGYLEATQRALLGQHSLENAVCLLRHSTIETAEELEHHLVNLVNRIVAENPDLDTLTDLIKKQEITWIDSVEIFHSEPIIWHLDSPTQFSELRTNTIFLKGWILLKSSDENLTIKLTVGNRLIQEIFVNLYRSDVDNSYPEIQRKFNAFEDTINLKLLHFFQNELNLIIKLKLGKKNDHLLGTVTIKRNFLLENLKSKFPCLTKTSVKILENLEKLIT